MKIIFFVLLILNNQALEYKNDIYQDHGHYTVHIKHTHTRLLIIPCKHIWYDCHFPSNPLTLNKKQTDK
jgi:hypothetical protein